MVHDSVDDLFFSHLFPVVLHLGLVLLLLFLLQPCFKPFFKRVCLVFSDSGRDLGGNLTGFQYLKVTQSSGPTP